MIRQKARTDFFKNKDKDAHLRLCKECFSLLKDDQIVCFECGCLQDVNTGRDYK